MEQLEKGVVCSESVDLYIPINEKGLITKITLNHNAARR
jgi:hypothetical protein